MQSIERYGVVALLFLIVTVAAVLMWGDGDDKPRESRAAVAARNDGTAPTAGNTVVRANTAAQRNAPLTDERARQREERRAKAEEPLGDRLGVPSVPSRAGGASSASGIVRGTGSARSDENRRGSQAELDSSENHGGAQLAAWEEENNQAESQQVQSRAAETKAESRKRGRGKKSRQGVPVYVVRKNEVLGIISQRELGTVKRMQEIIDLNPGLNPNRITEGLELRMPTNWSAGASPQVASASTPRKQQERGTAKAAPTGMRSYVVKDGDSLWRIAGSELGGGNRFKEIERANPSVKGGRIRKGQTIFLPAAQTAPVVASAEPRVISRAADSNTTTRGRVR